MLPDQPDPLMAPPAPDPAQGPAPMSDVLPLSEDDLAMWRGAIEQARAMKKTVSSWWDANLKKYAPDLSGDPDGYGTQLNTNRDFTLVERKKADLFYQSPAVMLKAAPLMQGQETILESHEAVMNERLGPDGVNAKALVHQVLFDVLCPAGTGWTIMGYESATVDVPQQHPVTGQMVNAPTPVYEDCYWRFVPCRMGLIPADFHSTIWDDAPWLGIEFEMPLRAAKRKKWVADDFKGDAADPELHFDFGLGPAGGDTVARGVMIYYKSSIYRDDRVHPLHYSLLILMEGSETPAVHKDSPLQELNPQGKLAPWSLLGNPIHPLTIRTMTDAAYLASDCTISRPLVNELNTFRDQMVQFRDAAILRWQYNVDTLPDDALKKIVRSPIGGFIGVPTEAYVGDGAIKELPHGNYPRENFQIADYIDHDLARTHALDANQAGAQAQGSQTATEAQLSQNNVNARLGFERGIVLDWYCKGVSKYSSLLQRFFPLEQAAAILGAQAAQVWDQWRAQVPSTLAFTALPDSALRTDLATERKRAMDEYTYFAHDQYINRAALLKQLLPRLHYSQKLLNTAPPEKGPEPTKPGLSLKGEDMNPLNPQYNNVFQLLTQLGIKNLTPPILAPQQAADLQAALHPEGQAPHGGKLAPMESLDKHAVDETGGMQGTGAPAPMGAAGGMIQ